MWNLKLILTIVLFSYILEFLCFPCFIPATMPFNIDWAVQLFDFRNLVAFVLSLTTELLEFSLAKRILSISGTECTVMQIESAAASAEPSRDLHTLASHVDSLDNFANSLALRGANLQVKKSASKFSELNDDFGTDLYQPSSGNGARICGLITLFILFCIIKRRTRITSFCRKVWKTALKNHHKNAIVQIAPTRCVVTDLIDWTPEQKVPGVHSSSFLLREDIENVLLEVYQDKSEEIKSVLYCIPQMQAASAQFLGYWIPYLVDDKLARVIKHSKDYPFHLVSDSEPYFEQGGSSTSVDTTSSSISSHHLKAFTSATPGPDTLTIMESTIEIDSYLVDEEFYAVLQTIENGEVSDLNSFNVLERAEFIHESMHHVDAFRRAVTTSRKWMSRLRKSLDTMTEVQALYRVRDTECKLLRIRMQKSYNYLREAHNFDYHKFLETIARADKMFTSETQLQGRLKQMRKWYVIRSAYKQMKDFLERKDDFLVSLFIECSSIVRQYEDLRRTAYGCAFADEFYLRCQEPIYL